MLQLAPRSPALQLVAWPLVLHPAARILEAGEANGTFVGVRSGVIVLLSTPRIYHCIASEAAKFLSLDVFSQVYMG